MLLLSPQYFEVVRIKAVVCDQQLARCLGRSYINARGGRLIMATYVKASDGMLLMDVYTGNEGYCFISYAHSDAKRVLPFVTEMQKRGVRIWLDEGIDPGTEWADFIARRIDSSQMLIVFLSKVATTRRNVRSEVMYALSLDKPILCLYLEDFQLTGGMAMQLSIFQAVHLYRYPSAERAVDRLIGSLPASTRESVSQGEPPFQGLATYVPTEGKPGTLGVILAAVMTGEVKPLAESSDHVFASLAMGDGYMVEPTNGLVYSPVSGTIMATSPVKNWLSIMSDEGVEVLVHVGIDTVELDGTQFLYHCSSKQHVSAGDLLLQADLDAIRAAGKSTETVVIVTSTERYEPYPSVLFEGGFKMAGQACYHILK